jgi:DNA-directed RNA polymerase specialized sigma24 family protein
MILYINQRLDQWGLWCRTGRERAGYPKRAAFMRLVPATGGGDVVICDDEAMQINRAVQSLDSELREVVDLYYIKMRSCPAGTIARSLRCHRDTLYARLHRAHLLVMDAIHDEELLTPSDTLCKKRSSCG